MYYDKIIQLGNVREHKRHNSNRDRIYSDGGIMATVYNYAGGGI